jgi:hypothetical protein
MRCSIRWGTSSAAAGASPLGRSRSGLAAHDRIPPQRGHVTAWLSSDVMCSGRLLNLPVTLVTAIAVVARDHEYRYSQLRGDGLNSRTRLWPAGWLDDRVPARPRSTISPPPPAGRQISWED